MAKAVFFFFAFLSQILAQNFLMLLVGHLCHVFASENSIWLKKNMAIMTHTEECILLTILTTSNKPTPPWHWFCFNNIRFHAPARKVLATFNHNMSWKQSSDSTTSFCIIKYKSSTHDCLHSKWTWRWWNEPVKFFYFKHSHSVNFGPTLIHGIALHDHPDLFLMHP